LRTAFAVIIRFLCKLFKALDNIGFVFAHVR
jgi:hypothetical protein